MADDPNPTRTKLDFLYQEVLGEVGELVTRIEQVNQQNQSLAARLEDSNQAIANAPAEVRKAIETSGKALASTLTAICEEALSDVQAQLRALAKDAATYAAIAHQSARKMAFIALIVGGTAGILGGLLGGFALSRLIG